MTFRAGGIFSGLDTNSIIEQLVALERIPIQNLQKKQETINTQKSLLSEISSALTELKTLLSGMDRTSEVLAYTAQSSDESVLRASASGSASPGVYSIQVLQRARAEQDRSVAFASADAEVKAGSIEITVGSADPVTVAIEEGMTLADVAYAINQSGAAVNAAVIDTGSSAYLTIYARDTGYEGVADDALVIAESYTGSTGQELSLTQTVQAQNAQIVFDGLTVERRENRITDVVAGLTLDVLDDTGQPTVEITVLGDTETIKGRVQGFVDAYNKVVSLLHSQFVRDADGGVGVMFGDSTLRSLLSRLQLAAGEPVSQSGSDIATLYQIGLKTGSDGTLSVDAVTLDAALAEDPSGVAGLFAEESTGLADRMSGLVTEFTDVVSGILVERQEGLDTRYENLEDQIARMEQRVEDYEKLLVQQFTYLETVISQLKAQQTSLLNWSSQFSASQNG
ncbi:MAG: flagellar filament capping protein FliD [Myxococcales bacterium]|nr:flagellar filament capping protein FliD [Myxococcales bacterium]